MIQTHTAYNSDSPIFTIIKRLGDYERDISIFKSRPNNDRKNKKYISDTEKAIQFHENAIRLLDYEYNADIYEPNKNANDCTQGLDAAYYSFDNDSDFEYFLNHLQNKILAYRKLLAIRKFKEQIGFKSDMKLIEG